MKHRTVSLPLVAACLVIGLVVSGTRAAMATGGSDALLSEISLLAKGGTPGLAIALMDRHQPSAEEDPQAWMRWERERVYIHQTQGDWESALGRLRVLPAGLPADFVRWAWTTMAAADIAQGRSERARRRLAKLIWTSSAQALVQDLPEWRRLVIRAYLREGRVGDAHGAMLRYQQDYGEDAKERQLLQAEVLLQADRPEDAAQVLRDADTPRAQALLLVARARTGLGGTAGMREQAMAYLDSGELDDGTAYQFWGALTELARAQGDRAGEVFALENAVSLHRRAPSGEGLVKVDADALWQAYAGLAQQLANERQLLVGNFGEWFVLAEKLSEQEPVGARSLYAYLGSHAGEAGERDMAHGRLVALLSAEKRDRELLRQLYLGSSQFPALDAVPKVARYALVDHAIDEGDVELALRLMSGLEGPPPGADALTWDLRSAWVLILAGRHTDGIAIVQGLIEGQERIEPVLVDRIKHVLLDLQTLGEHQAAYELFEAMLVRVEDPRLERELLYWMGDSRAAQGAYEEAARLYLRSAMLPDPNSMDPWSRTARYQAAQVLAKAGLTGDARVVYEGLLEVTTEPARRAVLRRAIQQLAVIREVGPVHGAAD